MGGAVFVDASAIGRTFPLHARRPDARLNRRAVRDADRVTWERADLPSGAAHVIAPVEPKVGALIRVDVVGPLEQRAGYHDPCGGWSDGHDAVADRLCAAFELGDVLLVMDTPGGAVAGLAAGIERAQKAKAHHGRRVTVFASELIASAGIAWAYGVGDEVYVPTHGQVGSIGAVGGHRSIAAMLAKEGIEVTFFTWPTEGKIALAGERPLSDIGRERGTRDISYFGEWFASLVETSPIGQRHGLTRDVIVALGADVLTGENAVAGGLADGVASEEEVTEYALSLAESGGSDMGIKTRAEDEKPDKPESEDGPGEGKAQCAKCKDENPADANYCAKCGARMEDEPESEEPDDEPKKPEERTEDDDEPPPSSKPMPPREQARATIVRRDMGLSLAPLLGISEKASAPAQRQAALDMRAIVTHAAKITGTRDTQEILAGLDVLAKDAANASRYRRERNLAISDRDTSEKMHLADRLLAAGSDAYTRSDVFVDEVSAKGERTGVKLTEEFAEMSVPRMRKIVERIEAKAPPRDPFQPAPIEDASAKSSAANPKSLPISGEPTDAQIAKAMELPAVKQIVAASGRDPKSVAATYLKTAARMANGAA